MRYGYIAARFGGLASKIGDDLGGGLGLCSLRSHHNRILWT